MSDDRTTEERILDLLEEMDTRLFIIETLALFVTARDFGINLNEPFSTGHMVEALISEYEQKHKRA